MAKKYYNTKYLAITVFQAVVLATSNYYGSWPQDYESQTAVKKMEYLWTQVNKDHNPGSYPSIFGLAKLAAPTAIGGLDLMNPGTLVSDQFKDGRPKGIHSVGLVGKVRFNWDKPTIQKLGLTGAFTESTNIIARASSGMQLTTGAVPAMAFKHLRNGVPSGNIFASHSVLPQKTNNFFEQIFANHVPNNAAGFSKEGLTAAFQNYVFTKGPKYHGICSNAEWARYTSDGKEASKIVAPWTLIWNPIAGVQKECANAKLEGETFGCIRNLKPGRVLWTVWGVMEPKDTVTQDDVIYQGELQVVEPFVSSKFGDQQLNFKHVFQPEEVTLMKNDWDTKYNPDSFMDKEGSDKYKAFVQGKNGVQKRRRLNKKYAKY